MKINKRSWHYRLLCFMDFLHPQTQAVSLCYYFWWMVASIVLIGGLTSMALYVIVTLTWHFVAFFGFTELNWYTDVGAFLFVCVMIVIGGLFGYSQYKIYKSNRDQEEREYKPNVLVEYIRARKSKFCPTIEITE